MLMLDYRVLAWWYWLVTAILLSLGLTGVPLAFFLAILVSATQLIQFYIREHSPTALPVQVRTGFLLLLLVAHPDTMRWLYWLPCIGTWAQVIFGYCLMARLVSLLPWNREEKLTVRLVADTLLSAPVRGNIRQGLPPQ